MATSPAYKIRISNISAIIWRNIGDNGRPWYSVENKRSYKNSDGEWRDISAFGYDDILTLNKANDLAHTWITHQMEADRKARKEKEAA